MDNPQSDKLYRLKTQFDVTGIRYTVRAMPSGAQSICIPCPFLVDADEPTHDAAEIFVSANGVESFACGHPACQQRTVADAMKRMGLTWWTDAKHIAPCDTFAAFRNQFKSDVRRPIVQGWLSERDIANVIGSSKAKKSLWASQLVLSIASERPFLNLYPTFYRGKILVLDYELHADTIIDRIGRQCEAMQLSDDVLDRFTVHRMRGDNYMRLDEMAEWLKSLQYGAYSLVIIDALYRAFPKGMNENDNAAMTECFNLLDSAADKHGCAFLNVHHASKGNQSDKKTADIGSGAGSQSRAVDAHIVLVEHSQPDHVSMRSIVRACPALDPVALRCDWPLWVHADDVDPDDTAKAPLMTVDELVELVPMEPTGKANFLAVKHRQASKKDAKRLLDEAIRTGLVLEFKKGGANTPTLIQRA